VERLGAAREFLRDTLASALDLAGVQFDRQGASQAAVSAAPPSDRPVPYVGQETDNMSFLSHIFSMKNWGYHYESLEDPPRIQPSRSRWRADLKPARQRKRFVLLSALS
jgi:hypothetical protein